MEIIKVNKSNLHIYMNVGQHYASEFSPIIKQLPEKDGKFHLDSPLEGDETGYLLYIDGLPAGLALIANESEGHYEIYEFYILPIFRKNKVGQNFAHALFNMMPGKWVSKQVAGADHAVIFWRRAIGAYTHEQYVEDMYEDLKWGLVTRQSFSTFS